MPVKFDDLFPKQQKAVRHSSGPLLVLAGPGTGKTEVLTHRIAYLVKNKVNPKEILGVTFSRKAAGEIADRLKEFQGFEKNRPRISTLHAEALRILGGLGAGQKFLLDGDEATLLMMDAAEDLGLNLKVKELRKLGKKIGFLKANNKLPNEMISPDNQTLLLKKLYQRYEELLDFNSAIDLDGLVLKVVRLLFLTNSSYEANIRHVLIDEYQDINQAEFNFIQILAKDIDSLFAVGDDDQSIYGWRGADPNIIRNFSKDFHNAQVEILEESHRCTEHILKAAQAIVSKDPRYQLKPMRSVKGEGSPVHIVMSKSWTAEAVWIAQQIKDMLSGGLVTPSKVVVLSKDLRLVDLLAEQLRIARIDSVYWRSGGLFADDAVRDILAHIRLLLDQEDNLAVRRCIDTETGSRIGKTGIYHIRRIAEKKSCCMWEVLLNCQKFAELQKWQDHIRRFVSKMKELEVESSKTPLSKIIHLVAKEIGASEKKSVERLTLFVKSLREDINLEDFFAEVNKNRRLDLAGGAPEPEEKKDSVTIMSLHSAKGLTYDVVFLVGMDEDILPDSSQDINEQRRLCYVAMTRAKKDLFLCHAKMRKGPAAQGWRFYNPSRFLNEIPREHKEVLRNR
jgi:DNA helicase-2/ATP-dependent DNA helicase PcrA